MNDWADEKTYAEAKGLSHSTLKIMRENGELKEGEDWKRDGRKTVYKLTPPDEIKPVTKLGEAVVVRRSANPMILVCEVGGAINQNVRVKNNSKFIPGMTMRVRKMQDSNLWHYEGQCPRFMGRW